MNATLTIEDLETLAGEIEATDAAERVRLMRLIRAFTRIIGIREPNKFSCMPLEYSDEDGHWDNSYPPEQKYKERRGPRLIEIASETTEDIATSGGFYHDYRIATTDQGLYVRRDGTLFGCDMTGTGSVGQYAAHPGACGVMCELEWNELEAGNVSLQRLGQAEEKLRKLAFPLVAAKG